MSRRRLSLVLSFVLLVVMGSLTLLALGFNDEARRVPLVVGVPTTALLAIQVVKDLLGALRGTESEADEYGTRSADQQFGADSARAAAHAEPGAESREVEASPSAMPSVAVDASEPRASVRQSFGWILALAVSFYTFGMLLAVPVFVGTFMRVYGRERWRAVLLSVGGIAAVLHFFFVILLEIRLYPGIMGRLIGP